MDASSSFTFFDAPTDAPVDTLTNDPVSVPVAVAVLAQFVTLHVPLNAKVNALVGALSLPYLSSLPSPVLLLPNDRNAYLCHYRHPAPACTIALSLPVSLPLPLPCPRLALFNTLALTTLAAAAIDALERDAIFDAIAFIIALVVAIPYAPALANAHVTTDALVRTFEILLPLHTSIASVRDLSVRVLLSIFHVFLEYRSCVSCLCSIIRSSRRRML